jgi:hypothetical protein
MIELLASNNVGDPDTWPEAFAYAALFLAMAGCVVVAWFKWGKAAYNEEEASKEARRDRGASGQWEEQVDP